MTQGPHTGLAVVSLGKKILFRFGAQAHVDYTAWWALGEGGFTLQSCAGHTPFR